MSNMIDDVTRYETATFKYSEDGPGAYTFMVVRISNPNEILRRAGWRDGHVLFLKVDGDITEASHDPFKIATKIVAADDDYLVRLLSDIREGVLSFDDIDGRVIHQGEEVLSA